MTTQILLGSNKISLAVPFDCYNLFLSKQMIRNELEKLIAEKRACVGVAGLGYVGLPLIIEFCLKGFRGIGFEVDSKKADQINAGK